MLYLNSVTNSNFLVSLEVSAVCFAFTVQLSIALQSKQQDLSKALSDVLVIKVYAVMQIINFNKYLMTLSQWEKV